MADGMTMDLFDPVVRAGSLCDIAPSRFGRFERDEYFTLDANWIIPALCRAVLIEGPIKVECAGRGHLVVELRKRGFEVDAADLHEYEDPLVDDIVTDADVFDIDSLSGYRFVITNLPYADQNAILRHVLPIAARDGCFVATLARSEWRSAKDRRALVHDNPHFLGEIALTKRPVWVRPVTKSPRHWFSWFVWSPEPRAPGQDAFLRFAGDEHPIPGRAASRLKGRSNNDENS
jgi:hypothetical protein